MGSNDRLGLLDFEDGNILNCGSQLLWDFSIRLCSSSLFLIEGSIETDSETPSALFARELFFFLVSSWMNSGSLLY